MSLKWKVGLLVAGLAGLFAWAYAPTALDLVSVWDREPDYSHGFLVIPISLFILWVRRDRFPGFASGFSWSHAGGLVLLALSLALRFVGGLFYVDAVDGWSIPLWVGGVVWVLGGFRFFLWCLPSVVFLWFMIPLPWRVEHALSWPLQRVAAILSCWILQCLAQPALAQGNTIFLHDFPLEVEQACSGLRMFVGFFALAAAYMLIVKRPWWQNVMLLIFVTPIALLSNALRITITGLLWHFVSGDVANKFSHDFAGYVMVVMAAGFMGLLLLYMNRLVLEAETIQPQQRPHRATPATAKGGG